MSSPMQSKSPAGGPGLAEKNKNGCSTPFLTHQPRAVNQNPDLTRTPPADPDAEQSVLAGILLRPERMIDLGLTAGSFYSREHQTVFAAMLRLKEQNTPTDMMTLADALTRSGELDRIGGRPYLAGFASGFTGNFNEAVRIVQEMETRRSLVDTALAIFDGAHNGARDLAEVVALARSSGPSEPEGAPWKLARELFPRIPFPWEVLPPVIGASLKQLARACATSAISLLGQVLCLVAAALGRKLDVLAKASWREPLVFWACDIRDSGAGKTGTMWELARELTRRQANEHERFKAEQDEWGKTSPQDRQGMTPPRNPRGYFTTNLTLEGVHRDLDGHHTGGLAVLLSELSALISGQNQYKKGGTDREGWLCLHDGKPARVTRARGSVFIQGARVQVCGGIQPGIFRQVFGGDGGQYIEDGTVFRCLFTFEPAMHHELTAESWTDEHRETWAATLGRALDWADRQQESLLLSLAPDAQARFFEWRNALDVQRLDLPPNFRGFLPKAYGYALRIAGALHALERFAMGREPGDTLTLPEMERAILAVHFFLGQAVNALRLLVGDGPATAPVEVSARTVLLAQVLEALRGQVDNGRLAVGFV